LAKSKPLIPTKVLSLIFFQRKYTKVEEPWEKLSKEAYDKELSKEWDDVKKKFLADWKIEEDKKIAEAKIKGLTYTKPNNSKRLAHEL
jgi:hypothetical protein